MRKLLYLICPVILVMVVAGCSSSRRGEGTNMTKQELSAVKNRYESVIDNSFDYDILQAKAKYTFKGKTLNGKINIEHGKRLCMTVTVLGFEVARIEADTKEVFVVDKFDKVYSKASISEFASRLGLQDETNFDAIEALLLGRIFIPGQGVAKEKDFKNLSWSAEESGDLIGQYKGGRYYLTYSIGQSDKLKETQVTLAGGGSSFSWNYDSWTDVKNGMLPEQQILNAKTQSIDLSAKIALSSINAEARNWNSFTPSDYREVSFAELLEIIKKVAG